MKVSISALSKFHAFDLAEGLRQRGLLHRLYTGYPLVKVPEKLRPYAKTCPFFTVPMMLAGRYGFERLQHWLNIAATIDFDKWVAMNLDRCDVFHCWASYGMEATTRANAMGMKTICDRGSTHVLHQKITLELEAARWGTFSPRYSSTLVRRELEQYKAARFITVPSRQSAETFVHGNLKGKVVVVPYGVDLLKFRPMQKEDETFRVLYVGALSLRKGIPYLVRAYLEAYQPGMQLWLIGAPLKETSPFLKDLAGKGVKAWGAVPQDKLSWFYSQASVVCLPSIEEGLALVLGQSLACGTPVMATKESGVEELITDGVEGFVVKARDPQDMAKYLTRMYRTPNEVQWMRKRIAEHRGQWHWRHYIDRMVKLYAS